MSSNVNGTDNHIWKINIPHTLFNSDKGYIFGFILSEKRFICVTSVAGGDTIGRHAKDNEGDLQCLGYWHGTAAVVSYIKPKVFQKTISPQDQLLVWLDISRSAEGSPECNFQHSDRKDVMLQRKSATCIMFHAQELLSSYLLRNVGQQMCTETHSLQGCHDLLNLNTLVYFLYRHLQLECKTDIQKTDDFAKMLIEKGSQESLVGAIFLMIATFLCWVYIFLGNLLDNRLMNSHYLKQVVNHIAFFHQIKLRYLQVKQFWNMGVNDKFQEIRCLNVHTRLILDMALGLILMVFLMWSGATDVMAAYTITWADSVLVWLNQLLNWLMGVPAGLKLNSQLDQFLGRFFHYHIYLWTGYLSILKPILAPLLWYSSVVGVLGLSTQLCLLQDIFSTLTVHIYCFYVYAARLYYFQLYGLSSLWRLFRGKKWNVLRRRVDSASYDVDQLFVGTLLFTILLFLLPTTALYYVVFLGLRLLVLSLTGIVSKTVSLINTLPTHGLLLRLFQSPKTTGDIMMTVLPGQTSGQSLFVAMKTIQVPYGQLIRLLTEENARMHSQPRYTWGSLLHRMLSGELIYPWVEPAVN